MVIAISEITLKDLCDGSLLWELYIQIGYDLFVIPALEGNFTRLYC
jgi:hypothetical protein